MDPLDIESTSDQSTLTKKQQKQQQLQVATFQRATIRSIPKPLRIETDRICILPFHVPLIIEPNSASTQMDFWNYIYEVQDVNISKENKLVNISFNKRNGYQPAPKYYTYEKIQSLMGEKSSALIKEIDTFTTEYEKFQQRANVQNGVIQGDITQYLAKMNDFTKKKIQKINKFYPCLTLKYRPRDNELQFTELAFNERMLSLLGVNKNQFITKIFEDGIPNFCQTKKEENCIDHELNQFREAFQMSRSANSYQSGVKSMQLYTQGGYLIESEFKNYVLEVNEKGEVGYDCLLVFVSHKKPVKMEEEEIKQINTGQINENLEAMKREKEQQWVDFTFNYYNYKTALVKNDPERICSIKNITESPSDKSSIPSLF